MKANSHEIVGDGVTYRQLGGMEALAGIPAETLEELQRRCRWLDLDEGDILVPAGKPLERVFLVARGELFLSYYTATGGLVWLRGAGQGGLLCEAAFVDVPATRYSIEAGRPSLLASLSAWTFIELMERDRSLQRAAVRSLVSRMNTVADQLVELTTLNVETRIHNELRRLARDGMAPDGSATISPFPKHADFARRVGTHREAVSRELSQLQHRAIVIRTGRGLTIPDISRLA